MNVILENKLTQIGCLYNIGLALRGEHLPSTMCRIVDWIALRYGNVLVRILADKPLAELRYCLHKYEVFELNKGA